MKRPQTKEDLKKLIGTIPVSRYLDQMGIQIHQKGSRKFINCLVHEDKNPSMQVNKAYLYCYSCKARLDLIDLVMKDKGIDFNEAIDQIALLYGLPGGAINPLGAESNRLPPRKVSMQKKTLKPKLKKVYFYQDDTGKDILRVTRIEKQEPGESGSTYKTFIQHRLVPSPGYN